MTNLKTLRSASEPRESPHLPGIGTAGPHDVDGAYNITCNRGEVDDLYYRGAWDAPEPGDPVSTYHVDGEAETIANGTLIRSSGATTGELLLKIYDWDADFNCDNPDGTLCSGASAVRRDGSPSTIATAKGDSGGPVVKTATSGSTTVVKAMGIISSSGGSVSCNQEGPKDEVRGDDASNGTCTKYMYYARFPEVRAALGAALK